MTSQAELWERELIVWVMPTAGGGVPPVGFNKLWNSLLHPGLPGDLLEDLRSVLFPRSMRLMLMKLGIGSRCLDWETRVIPSINGSRGRS